MHTYTGKWGKYQRQCDTAGKLGKVVEEHSALPGYEIFGYFDEQDDLIEEKKALLELSESKLYRELEKAA